MQMTCKLVTAHRRRSSYRQVLQHAPWWTTYELFPGGIYTNHVQAPRPNHIISIHTSGERPQFQIQKSNFFFGSKHIQPLPVNTMSQPRFRIRVWPPPLYTPYATKLEF